MGSPDNPDYVRLPMAIFELVGQETFRDLQAHEARCTERSLSFDVGNKRSVRRITVTAPEWRLDYPPFGCDPGRYTILGERIARKATTATSVCKLIDVEAKDLSRMVRFVADAFS